MNNSSARSIRVLITGALGQDGTLLRQFLEELKIPYLGISRPSNNLPTSAMLSNNLNNSVLSIDMVNIENVKALVTSFKPTHIFHLATLNGSGRELDKNLWDTRHQELIETQVFIFQNIIDVVRLSGLKINIVVAGSSRMYNPNLHILSPVNEQSEPSPVDAYGNAKAECMKISRVARQNGMHVSTAILFNHESILRKKGFLFPDLAFEVSQYILGKSEFVSVENANAQRDWHSALDTVQGIWMQANLDSPQDLVFCSGQISTVRDLVEELFVSYFKNIPIPFLISSRESEIWDTVLGDNSFAKSLGWEVDTSVINILYNLVRNELDNKYLRQV
jgi:GDPmannose 4,6-dehydratase